MPIIGARLQEPLVQLLQNQKAKLHGKGGKSSGESGSWLASLFEKVVIAMVIYFVISIVNSLAQNYHDRLQKRKCGDSHSSAGSKNRRKIQAAWKKA